MQCVLANSPASGPSEDVSATLADFRRVSARIGADPLLTQGAGGNTSVKLDDVLWVKASGAWLSNAVDQDIMVPVDLPALRMAIKGGDSSAENAAGFILADLSDAGLRPSIETVVHAVLVNKVVLHVHSVDAIAFAVLEDPTVSLARRLSGLRWALVPYRRPGLPLAQAILEAAPGGDVDVLILANHGLIITGRTVAEAEAMLNEVVERLAVTARPAAEANRDALRLIAMGTGYRLPEDIEVHALATDPVRSALIGGGNLYPDHIIFLGVAPMAIDPDDEIAPALARHTAQFGVWPKWILVRNLGVLVDAEAVNGADAMLLCLTEVTGRISAGSRVRYLSEDDIHALTNWEAERYRQLLAKS